jgi:hypothetical protein
MNDFTPMLTISTGRTNAMFTLRETGQGMMGGIISHYITNLSINPDEAYVKAQEHSKAMGMPLHTTRKDLDEQLRQIERNLTGLSKEERLELIRLAALDDATAREQEWLTHCKECLDKGIFPWGNYRDKTLRTLPYSYITWAANTMFDDNTPMALVKIALIEQCNDLILTQPDKTRTIGTIGKREVFNNVQIIRVSGYDTDYGWKHVITMRTEGGACLVSKGAFYADIGEVVSFKATVKEYTEYKEQAQTVVQRVAMI